MPNYTASVSWFMTNVYNEILLVKSSHCGRNILGQKIKKGDFMDKNHFVSVAGLVTNHKNEVLLVKNPRRGWEFPGGMVEPGETLQEALIREIFEESGIHVIITGFIGVYKNIESDIVNLDFCCKYESGMPTISEESLEVGWFQMNEVVHMMGNPLYETRIKNMLSNNSNMFCYAFRKEPFLWSVVDEFKVGL